MSRRPAPVAPPPPPDGAEVFGLGGAATLAFVVERRRRQDRAAAEELRGVAAFADANRVDESRALISRAVDPQWPVYDEPLLGREGELRLAGEGAFAVREFAVAELAAALGMSEVATRSYVGQAVELRDRLPRLWARVMRGGVPAWKARQVAAETIRLSAEAAAYVDAQLAPFAHQLSFGRIIKVVEAAVLRHDPEAAAQRAREAAEKRGVWLEDRVDGTSEIRAVTGTPDAHAFDAARSEVAGSLRALGDARPEQVRRAKAVGVLADPQYALDLHASAGLAADGSVAARPPRLPSGTGMDKGASTIHIHLHTDAIAGVVGERTTGHVTRVQGLGARAVECAEQWLIDLAPGAHITIAPKVDLTEHISVNAYEAPERLRRQVEERDDGCRFPWCGRQGRYDLDHIDAYVDPDDGGPPGQTNSSNLARLCRFHHRVKTHSDWVYRREPDESLTWSSPLSRTYIVDHHGTRALD